MDRIRNFIAHVRSQLWLVPSIVVLAAAALAWVLLRYGHTLVPPEATGNWWLYSGQAGTARDLLSSLLSGLMTMTSLVVSITFVILTLAANQLGPRLIGIFKRDRQIQGVIGLFIGTIVYVVLIMRKLDDTLGPEGVPHLAITTATVLTIVCLLALLFYLHKVATLIIADTVVETVARELRGTFRDILPNGEDDDGNNEDGNNEDEDETEETPEPDDRAARPWPIALQKPGYLQVVDYDRLVALACKRNLRVEVTVRAGHHLLRGGAHVIVYAAQEPDDQMVGAIRKAFAIGAMRTPAQDPEQGIRELVEIATRALSPGTNDPFTAFAVIDRLGTAFEDVFERAEQRRVFRDKGGVVRLRAVRADVGGLLDAAVHPIRQAGQGHPGLLIQLADMIRKLAPAMRTAPQHRALTAELDRIAETATLGQFAPADRDDVARRIELARRAVNTAAVRLARTD
jgi:uncharacterized membrane protein